MGKIEDLKYVIYDEWSYDPPAGQVTDYYDTWAETYEDLLTDLDTIYEHIGYYFGDFGFDEDDEESEDEYDEDEDFSEFKQIYKEQKPTEEWIRSFNWSNGGIGSSCILLVKGKDIAPAAANFYREHLAYYDKKKETEHLSILNKAEQNPEDYDSVIALLKILRELIDIHNDKQH